MTHPTFTAKLDEMLALLERAMTPSSKEAAQLNCAICRSCSASC
jgi:hypothetical protein